MSTPSHPSNPAAPVTLTFEAIDELIYDARLGDLDALESEITKWSREHNVHASSIIRSAVDTEDESEGGTGACLLHWPAANGNVELLNFILQCLTSDPSLTPDDLAPFINYRNHSGNTPLHWAALNTHLDCVKALVEAGADVDAKNDAGHDALFLAERADWSVTADDEEEDEEQQEQQKQPNGHDAEAEDKPAPPPTKARQVVEWLLTCEKGAGFGNTDSNSSSAAGGGNEEMEGVEETRTSS